MSADTCIVWTALIDSPEAFEIRTNPKNRHLFDPNGAEVIAYGSFESGQSIPEYIPFEIKLDYKSTQRIPRYILLFDEPLSAPDALPKLFVKVYTEEQTMDIC